MCSTYLQCTVTCDIYDSSLVLASQWQKTARKVHRSVEIHVDLMLNDGIGLPLEFAEAHDAGVVDQVAELCGKASEMV